jgi:hypothetical protein
VALLVVLSALAGCSVQKPVPAPTPAATSALVGCAAHPSTCGYPDATNTGVPKGTTLRLSGSVTADRAGMVIEDLDVTGEINVTAPNVTIRRVRVTGGRPVGNADWVVVVRPGADNLVIEDSELGTPPGTPQDMACVLNIGDANPTLRRLDIHGCSAGVSSGGGTIQDSYIHDMSAVPGLSHVVGIASNGGGGMTITHNTVLNTYEQTAAIAFYQDFADQANDLVTNNLVGGGGYCFYGGAGDKGATRAIKFVGNRLTRSIYPNCGSYGVIASFTLTDPENEFRGNIWDDTGAEVIP